MARDSSSEFARPGVGLHIAYDTGIIISARTSDAVCTWHPIIIVQYASSYFLFIQLFVWLYIFGCRGLHRNTSFSFLRSAGCSVATVKPIHTTISILPVYYFAAVPVAIYLFVSPSTESCTTYVYPSKQAFSVFAKGLNFLYVCDRSRGVLLPCPANTRAHFGNERWCIFSFTVQEVVPRASSLPVGAHGIDGIRCSCPPLVAPWPAVSALLLLAKQPHDMRTADKMFLHLGRKMPVYRLMVFDYLCTSSHVILVLQ